jgi:hypothetical protein
MRGRMRNADEDRYPRHSPTFGIFSPVTEKTRCVPYYRYYALQTPTYFREQRRLFDDSITNLGIGIYGDAVVTVTHQ